VRCIHCPTHENFRCAGLDVRRFCELIDPSCPQYDLRYFDVIVREAGQATEDIATRLKSSPELNFSKTIIEGGETIVIPFECCGVVCHLTFSTSLEAVAIRNFARWGRGAVKLDTRGTDHRNGFTLLAYWASCSR
jgi:hypothetical protein